MAFLGLAPAERGTSAVSTGEKQKTDKDLIGRLPKGRERDRRGKNETTRRKRLRKCFAHPLKKKMPTLGAKKQPVEGGMAGTGEKGRGSPLKKREPSGVKDTSAKKKKKD